MTQDGPAGEVRAAGEVARAAGEVRAAGGVMLRAGAGGVTETLLVHRPAYDDWTLPQGKADPGETDEACALREAWEETGLRCTLGRELAGASYTDGRGRAKRVRYWALEPLPDASAHTPFTPGDEVDALRWLPLPDAAALLTYDRDRDVLASLGATAAAAANATTDATAVPGA